MTSFASAENTVSHRKQSIESRDVDFYRKGINDLINRPLTEVYSITMIFIFIKYVLQYLFYLKGA